jgi:PKD repeat protein
MRTMGWISTAGIAVLAACGSNGGDVSGPPNNTPPVANFGVTCTGLACTFTDSSTDAEGSIAAWKWDFGDGNTATDQSPVHTYAAAQSYNVGLTVTDGAGATNSITKAAAPTAPTADLVCTDATVGGTPAICTLTLPVGASVQATLSNRTPCQAVGDVFAFTAPVADTLTADGCSAPIGTQVTLPASPAGTQVAINIQSGLAQYTTAVQVGGQYPAWTLNVEDAVGAPFPPDFTDMVVTLTVLPSGT